MNLQQAQENMIKQQLRTCKVLDDKLLEIIANTPRDHFVADAQKALAYADVQLPIGHNEVMLRPSEESQALQALKIQEQDTVLEIGTGTGYMTALLARLAKQVESVDIYPEFTQQAAAKLALLQITNAQLKTGDAATGWTSDSLFDVIVITGSVPQLPPAYLTLLKPGGRVVAFVGQAPVMQAIMIEHSNGKVGTQRVLFETVVPPLVNAQQPQAFQF